MLILASGQLGWLFTFGLPCPLIGLCLGTARWRWRYAKSRVLYILAYYVASLGALAYLISWGRGNQTAFPSGAEDLAFGFLMLATFLGPFMGLWLCLHYSGARSYPPGHCKRCGYDLSGNISGICSECGSKLSIAPSEQDDPKRAGQHDGKPAQATSSRPTFVVIGVLVLALVAIVSVGIALNSRSIEFNDEAWRKGSPKERLTMVDSLLGSDRLVGLSYREVTTLLGEPDKVSLTYSASDALFRVQFDTKKLVPGYSGFLRSTAPPPTPFDAERWRNTPFQKRLPMAVSIAENPEILSGKNREEIIRILGAPDVIESIS